MNIDTIKAELDGYFINRVSQPGIKASETLCKKINNADYEVCNNVETPNGIVSAYDLLLTQVNNQILDPTTSICRLSKILPVIDGSIFDKYFQREKIIEKHITWCDCIERDEYEYQDGKYLCKTKKPKGFKYWLVDGDKLTEIPGEILDESQKENCKRIRYPKLLLKALQDDLCNEFEEQYEEEVKKYQNI